MPKNVSPDKTDGTLLPETEEWDYLSGYPFSVSPDGTMLLFSRSADLGPPPPASDLADQMIRGLSAYRIYDLTDFQSRPIGLGPGVPELARRREGNYARGGGCWIPREGGWWPAMGIGYEGYLVADPRDASPHWAHLESEPYQEYCPLEDNMRVPESMGPFRIIEKVGRRARVGDAQRPEVTLATHRAPWFPGTDISLGHFRLAPDGTRLAYTTLSMFGMFGGKSQGYVLEYDPRGGGPVHLASGVHALRWGGDDSTIYAAVRTEKVSGIYRWSLAR